MVNEYGRPISKRTIVAHVPISNSEVQETGDFELERRDLSGGRSQDRIW